TMPTKPAPAPPVPGPMAVNGQAPGARMPSAQIPGGLMYGGHNTGAAASGAASPQDLQAVMAEVEKLGQVDPRAQAELLEELKQADPSLWPMTVKSVWSRVEYARRYGKGSNRQQLADRRSAATSTDSRRIDLDGDYPFTYPTTSPGGGYPSTGYPSTGRSAELSDLNIDAPAYPSTRYPSTGYPNTGASRASGPSIQPRHDNGPRDDNNLMPAEAPPWPNSGAAIKRTQPDRLATSQKSQPDGVIHTSYHSGPTEPHKLRSAKSDDPRNPDGDANRHGPAEVSSHEVQSGNWRPHVESAIAALESRLKSQEKDSKDATANVNDHARLRILQLLAGRRDGALSDMPIDDSAVRDFWSNELFGLDVLLDTQRFSRDTHRAGEAKRHLCQAVTALGESASLEIRNLAFCSKVQSYGSIERFEKREFLPGQRLLLYAEIDNFRSENSAKGYHTSLRSSFQIFDSSGRRVDKRESTTSEEYCQSPRRDYFIGCDFHLPEKIYPGQHTLKLTVEDLKSHKVAESSIDFTVKEK
ncbi:MAG: hypothetical protein JXM70_01085, partial [Pirellulales bacterium]|nr:hypothetical protein [Pirellulales bacterium]